MTEKEKYQSSFTLDNFSSTATLANNDQIKVPISNLEKINEKALEADYNPHDNRKLEHPNTYFGAVIHLIKSSLGTGILAIPRAFKSAGLIVGLFGTIFIGVMCTHTIHILVRASHRCCRKGKFPSLGFAETAEEVCRQGPPFLRRWSSFARNFVEIALVLTYYCGNAVYVVFITESMTKLFTNFYPEMANDWDQYFKLIILVPLILCCQVRELKHLVPFSFIANTSMVIAFGITLYYMFARLGSQKLSERNMATGVGGLPSFFSTVIFAMEGIGTIMPVENSMTKSKFDTRFGVLNVAMAVIVVMFASIGFFGYLSFGEATAASITYNLDTSEIAAQICQAAISLSVFFTFMLQFYVPVDITWRKIKHRIPENRHNISQILLRTGIVLFVVGIAALAGRHLGPLIDVVGAIFLATLGLLIPATIDLISRWEDWGFLKWILFKDVAIILFSLFVSCSGTYFAVLNMIES